MGAIECEEGRRGLGKDLEGSAEINTGNCGLSCSWGADGVSRKLRNGSSKVIFTFPFGRKLGKEIDGVELASVDCTLSYGGVDYTNSLPFPEGWTEVFKSADGADDYYALKTDFSFDLGDVEGLGSKCSVSGDLELEFYVGVGDTMEDGDSPAEMLIYEDQSIGVSC